MRRKPARESDYDTLVMFREDLAYVITWALITRAVQIDEDDQTSCDEFYARARLVVTEMLTKSGEEVRDGEDIPMDRLMISSMLALSDWLKLHLTGI